MIKKTFSKKKTLLKKTIAVALSLVLFPGICLILTSCHKTSPETLTVPDNQERLAIAAVETDNVDGTTGTDAAADAGSSSENFIFHYQNDEKTLTIDADAPVILPESDYAAAYQASGGTISQDLVTKIYDHLFPDGETYIFSGTDRTKAAIKQEIQKNRQYITDLESAPDLSEEYRQDSISDLQSIISDLENEYETAPEKSTLKKTPVDSTLMKNTASEAGNCDYELHCETESGASLDVWSYPADNPSSSAIYYNCCNPGSSGSFSGIQYYFNYNHAVSEEQARKESEKSMQLSYDDARKTAEDFLDSTGVKTGLLQTYLLKGIVRERGGSNNKYLSDSSVVTYEKNYSAFYFEYVRILENTELASCKMNSYVTDRDSETSKGMRWNAESISLIVSDSGIEAIEWKSPLNVEKAISDNVNLFPFESAASIFEEMMPEIYHSRLKMADSGDLTFSYRIHVSSVKLCLMQVQNSENEQSGLLVPAWVFYGEWWEKINEKDTAEKLFDSVPYVLFAVNAVDGTVIDPWEIY